MMITGIKPYSPIRQAQNFGKKKSDVDDYKTAEDAIRQINKEIDVTKNKIKALQKEYNTTPPKNIQNMISELQKELEKTNERLTKWQKIKTIIEKKLDIYV